MRHSGLSRISRIPVDSGCAIAEPDSAIAYQNDNCGIFQISIFRTFAIILSMNKDNKLSRLGLGLVIGAAAGALAGILYAPKSGKQTRKEAAKKLAELRDKFSDMEVDKKVRDIFGTVSEESKDLYLGVTKELLEKLADLRQRAGEINTKKYQKIVNEVLVDFKTKGQQSVQVVDKLRKHLLADWKSLFERKPARRPKASSKGSKPKRKARQ